MLTFVDRIYFNITGTPGSGSGFVVNTAESGFRVPADVSLANNAAVVVEAFEGTAWEIFDSVYTTVDTTFSRGALIASSTGSRITFTSAAKAGIICSARELLSFQVHVDTAAPSSPVNGQRWWNSEIGRMFIYYTDGSSDQWVEDFAPDGNTFSGDCGTAETEYFIHHIDCGAAA